MRGVVGQTVAPDALSVWVAMSPDVARSAPGRAPLAARIGARLLVGLSLVLFVLAVPARYSELVGVSRGVSRELGVVDGPLRYLLPEAGHYALGVLFLEIIFVFTFTIVSLAIAWRKKGDWPSLFFSTVFIAYAVWVTPTLDALALPPLLQPVADLTQAAGVLLAVMFFLLFPDGRFVPAWTRFSAVAWFFYCLAWGVFPGAWFSLIDPFEASFPAFLALLLLGWGLGLVAQAIRYHRADPRQRLMTKWVVLIVAAACVGYGLVYLPGAFLPASGYARGLYDLYGVPTFWLLALPMPVAFGIAMQRYHLFKADLIINRALVYGALTASVVALYVLIVGGTAVVFHSGGSFLVSLLATGLVAVLFAPLRDRLQRGVNRLLYGERDDPYAALSRLGQHLETKLTPDAVLPAVTRAVAEALKLPYVAVEVAGGGPDEVAAETGDPVEDPVRLPLLYGGERVGWLVLGRRAGEADFTPADRRLLGDLARQIGVEVHASRLTLDLQRSRERLVIAREEERRRLRRDLHDGVGPRLAALTLKIETARNKLARDPDAATLLSDLAERARDTVADVRRSVHALRPPVLDELGLVSALRETAAQYSQNGLRVSVEAPDDLESLPAAVEVAAYHIAQEAMTNVVRHAEAGSCTVGLDLDAEAGRLLLRVDDDGQGLGSQGPGSGSGVGLSSMRERAEELGGKCSVEPGPAGGTRVRVELPCVPETGS